MENLGKPTSIKIGLNIDAHSFNDTLEKLNQLNEALKTAKTLINELAENKVLLDLKLSDIQEEKQVVSPFL